MKAGFKDFLILAALLFFVCSLITLVKFYGGLPLPASAVADYCRREAVEAHQNYLTALTTFSEKSQKKLMREAQRRLEKVLDGCEKVV